MASLKAIVFDCDGVIAETERDGHRVAFNRAFQEKGINAEWSVEEYAGLVKVAGGKERMKAYFSQHPGLLPPKVSVDDCIADLHEVKTGIFMEMSASGELPIRSGIQRIVAEARRAKMLLAICSTSNERSVKSLVRALLGKSSLQWFAGIFAGDVVSRKKPAPDVYNIVKEQFSLAGEDCIVIEDTRNGLQAAKAAGMKCVVTTSFYSVDEDFTEADLVVSALGDPGLPPIRILQGNTALPDAFPYVSLDHLKNLVDGG